MSVGSYLLELTRWNVKNDGTDAVNTSKGINNALLWAAQQGFGEVVLPNGLYLVDENNPIQPQSFTTLNLGGATLRIRDNGLQGYSIVSFQKNQQFSRITNGKIQGDKNSHNYSSGGTHEGGYGIQVGSFTPQPEEGNNTRNIIIDNLEVFDCTGDAITINSTFGQIFPTPTDFASSWEQGGINPNDGTLTTNNNKIRSSLKIPMNQPLISKYGYFGLYGNGYGDLGTDIKSEFYDVIFYKSDNTFLSSKTQIQFFDEVPVPIDASYARIVLNQGNIPGKGKSSINIRVPSFPQYTYIERCNLHSCRRQGISICGTKNIYIKDNSIHHIKGTTPQAGIDIEDGYDLNQNIYIEGNQFHDNHMYDVVVTNGKCIYVEGNKFTKTYGGGPSLGINPGVDKALVNKNFFHNTKSILSGNITFLDNNVYATQVSILGSYNNRPIYISNNLFHNSKLVVDNPFPYLVKISSCRFFNDFDKVNTFTNFQWTLEIKNEPQIITNCIFEGQDLLYNAYIAPGAKSGWIIENSQFKSGATLFGRYVNCQFTGETNILGVKGTTLDSVEMINCKIISNDRNNTLITVNNLKSFRMIDCYIEKQGGHFFRGQNAEDIVLSGNTIKITNDSLPRSIIIFESTFKGKTITVTNNNVSATYLNQVGIENLIVNNPEIVIANNILKRASIKGNGAEILKNNIINGVISP